MNDPKESTWEVKPFDVEAWKAFASKDAFLTFQQRDMAKRVEATIAKNMHSGSAAVEEQRASLTRVYLEAQYNECHEDSVLARRWNEFASARGKAPRIELKKFHFAEFASEETNCYDAEVWVDGAPGFFAKNNGQGGSDHYTPLTYTDEGRAQMDVAMGILSTYADSLPADDAHGIALRPDAETLVGDAVSEKLKERIVGKFLKQMNARKRLYFVSGKDLMSLSLKSASDGYMKGAADFVMRKHPGAVIVNQMSEAEQRATLAKHV